MSRQKNSINNLKWGILGNIITSVVAIIIPRLFIVNYGSEVNGLLSSIRQIYVYLALLEAGVGDASVVALYGPIGRNDHKTVNKILAATHYYYKKIGIAYAACVLALGGIYPLLLDTTISYGTCFWVIVLQGSGSVISYFVQGKYNMLLRVDNKSYITTNLATVTSVMTDLIRIVLLLNGKSIIEVQATYLVFNLAKMLYVSWYMKKNYSHQISSLVFSHTDVLILTFVCGLKTVSIYSMYATIYGMVDNVINIISNSVQAALGQIFHTDRKKFLKLQEAFETYYLAIVFALLTIAFIFALPFMKLYTRGADINYVDYRLPILFTMYQLLSYGRASSNNILSFAGAFKETQWRAVLEATINLVVSFICVFKFGIYGVLFGTVVALIYRANDIILFANRRVLKRSAWATYRRWITDFFVLIVIIICFEKLQLRIETYTKLLVAGIWVSIVVVSIFIVVASVIEKQARETAIYYIRQMILKKL